MAPAARTAVTKTDPSFMVGGVDSEQSRLIRPMGLLYVMGAGPDLTMSIPFVVNTIGQSCW